MVLVFGKWWWYQKSTISLVLHTNLLNFGHWCASKDNIHVSFLLYFGIGMLLPLQFTRMNSGVVAIKGTSVVVVETGDNIGENKLHACSNRACKLGWNGSAEKLNTCRNNTNMSILMIISWPLNFFFHLIPVCFYTHSLGLKFTSNFSLGVKTHKTLMFCC